MYTVWSTLYIEFKYQEFKGGKILYSHKIYSQQTINLNVFLDEELPPAYSKNGAYMTSNTILAPYHIYKM